MIKHRISTTISQKHWELLKKYSEKYQTQQKALELSLESLDGLENLETCSKQSLESEWEKRSWMFIKSSRSMCFVQKAGLKLLIETADIERIKEFVIKNKPLEYNLEFIYQKPLKECSLKEIMDGLVAITREGNWNETVDYTNDIDHYKLIITHNMGLNNSKINTILFEGIFRSYGVKAESTISERTIFMKIFK